MPITSQDIQLYQSGSSGLGGAISGVLSSGFDAVLPAESSAGSVEYRCLYVRNSHASLTLTAAKMWLSANTPSSSTSIAIGLGTSAVGATEQSIANETTAPAGVTFVAAASEAAALVLGDLPAGQARAVWERRTVTAGAAALNQDTYERTVAGESPGAAVQSVWTGVPSVDGAVVSTRLGSAHTADGARIAVSRSSNLASPVYSPVVAPDTTYRVSKHVIGGLLPNTEYFYGVEVDGTLDTTTTGRFKTLPATGPAGFSIALGGCATNTDDSAFAAINALNPKPLFLLAMGDFQYMDIASPTTANYHTAFDTSLARSVRKVAHSQIPTVFMWDDHDFQTNDATGRDASNVARSFRATGLQFFRDRIPAITASSVVTDTAHYSFVVGRVRFVVSDTRSDKTLQSATDNSSKTMMGATQKAWFKAEIAAAKAAGQVVAWMNSVPWVVSATAGADDWGGYTTERAEISDYIKAQGMTGKVFILSADMHALAIHAGADYATGGGGAIPVFHAGPFNRTSSTKGGPYTYGPYPASGSAVVQQFGIMDVSDNGTELSVTWKGFSADGTLRMSHTFTPIAAPVTPKFEATGGSIAEPGDGYRYWTFASSDSLAVSQAGDVEYLVAAGGGAGSSGNTSAPGGGGAGGVLVGSRSIAVGTYPVTVGAGGVGASGSGGTKGSDSSIGTLVTALGGGTSGYSSVAPTTGGSGGGGGNAAVTQQGATGTAGQGSAGGNGYQETDQSSRSGGGGGGADGNGSNGVLGAGGNGGPGRTVWGRAVGGGGGGASQGATQGAGTHGGGSASKSGAAGNGTANTGGGGGGAALNQRSGDGGSGIVIIRRAI